MSADNRNQLHHDVLLHGRLFDALLSAHTLTTSDAGTALLAAYAGALTTLARLAHADAPDTAHLYEIICSSMARLPARLPPSERPRVTP